VIKQLTLQFSLLKMPLR